MSDTYDGAGNVLTLDEYRIRHSEMPRPRPTADVENLLVRPPAKPQVLVTKKVEGTRPTTKTAKKD